MCNKGFKTTWKGRLHRKPLPTANADGVFTPNLKTLAISYRKSTLLDADGMHNAGRYRAPPH